MKNDLTEVVFILDRSGESQCYHSFVWWWNRNVDIKNITSKDINI